MTTQFVHVTFIAAPAERVWAALTEPGMARAYWGHENISDWTEGATWSHVRADEGRRVNITGQVVEVRPFTRLVLTWASPARPEAISRVTFELTPFPGMTRLSVTHDRLEPDGSMLQGISKGWPIVLASLKSWLETGKALDVFAKPL